MFSILVNISSYPWESLDFKDCIKFSTSCDEIGFNCNKECGLIIFQFRFIIGSRVTLEPGHFFIMFITTEKKKELKELAMISGLLVSWYTIKKNKCSVANNFLWCCLFENTYPVPVWQDQ